MADNSKKPQPLDMPKALGSTGTGSHRCPRCGVTYVNPFPDAACWTCEQGDRDAARRRADRRRVSGIARRHARFLHWDDLSGPPKYLEAVRRIRAFVEHGDSVLATIGKRGLGKSQTSAVAVWQTIEHDRPARVINASELLADLKRRFDGGGDAEGAWLAEWTAPQLLCIDEIAELVAGEHGRAMLATLVDKRYGECRPTIISGNVDPTQLADVIGDSVTSRCSEGGGAVVFEGWPTFRSGRAVQA